MVLNFVLAFCVLFGVGILMIYQLYCLSRNQSNIEAWERSKVEGLVKKGKIPPVSKNSSQLSHFNAKKN
jgi:palmitoyltransferase